MQTLTNEERTGVFVTLQDLQEAALLSLGAAGKVLEVDDWAEAQVGQREQTARPLLEACLDKCRLVNASKNCLQLLWVPCVIDSSTRHLAGYHHHQLLLWGGLPQ